AVANAAHDLLVRKLLHGKDLTHDRISGFHRNRVSRHGKVTSFLNAPLTASPNRLLGLRSSGGHPMKRFPREAVDRPLSRQEALWVPSLTELLSVADFAGRWVVAAAQTWRFPSCPEYR